jgi:hypothetical protein
VHWPPPLIIPEELEDLEVEVPDVFKCPITLGIMTEPAQTPQGEKLTQRNRDFLQHRRVLA